MRLRQGAVSCLALGALGCGLADSAAKSPSASGATYAMADTGSMAGDSAGASDGMASSGTDSASSADVMAAAKDAKSDASATAMDAAASDVEAVPGTSEADQQKRTWRKLVESVPLASVSVGGDKKLDLVAMRVTVQVEGLRSRTLVDHIFKNPFDGKTLEGKFRYALPPDATVSYFGLFGVGTQTQPQFFGGADQLNGKDEETVAGAGPKQVAEGADPLTWGVLHEAKVVAQAIATQVYETEVNQKVDPALVEEIAPNTFEARVFPILPKGYNRVLVAYEQTLPLVAGKYAYTFVVPKGDMGALEFTLIAAKTAIAAAASSGSLTTKLTETKKHFVHHWQQPVDEKGGVLAVDLTSTAANTEADVLAGTDPVTKEAFAVLRLHPKLAELLGSKTAAKQAIFALDTSGSEAGRFDFDVKLMTGILAKSSTIEKFQVVTFDAGARWLSPAWLPNTQQGRDQALDLLDGALLEGATDFASALRILAQPPMAVTDKQADVFVMSDGVVDFGETSPETLLSQWQATAPWQARFFAYRTGIGADNLALFQALTRKGGAVFNCLTASELPACSVAHEAPGILVDSVTVEPVGNDGAQLTDVLVAGRQATLFPGATLMLAGRLVKPGAAVVHVKGTAPGKGPIDVAVTVTLQPAGELAPRAWAEIAVAQLLETHEGKFEGLALALSQHYGIASRLGSFLVLESSATWKKYELGDESKKLGGAILQKLIEAALTAKGKAWTSWQQLLAAVQAGNGTSQVMQVDGGKLLDMVQTVLTDDELQLPVPTLLIPLVKMTSDVPADYLKALKAKAAFVVDPFSVEGERRRDLGQTGAAVRALTTALEFNPSDAEVERLIGYRVRSWQQPAMASALFLDVLRKRPFEPQSYRDLAGTLANVRPRLAMLLYEAVLAGKWNQKFKAVKTVTEEEYALFIQGLGQQDPKHALNPYLAERKQALKLKSPTGDLRVTITWNTDNTDIDLWVTDPNGEKCFYGHKDTKAGGHLLDDLTQGYGPERFVAEKALPGEYKIEAHYYGNNGNALEATTYVTATVMSHIGKPNQSLQTFDFVLHKNGEVATVAKVSYK